jgi:polysaccharide export outer membrane protein
VKGFCGVLVVGLLAAVGATDASAQRAGNASPNTAARPTNPVPPVKAAAVPADYVIGADDILTIFFWREKDLSQDVTVRPDGRISLPLLNEIQAAGLTPEQLRVQVTEAAEKLMEEPTVAVIVKQINSRKVFITGQVAKVGSYPLAGPTNVMQLITMAGGVLEYADSKNIQIIRTENGQPHSIRFNYDEVKRGKNLQQNILLRPGDTVVVP